MSWSTSPSSLPTPSSSAGRECSHAALGRPPRRPRVMRSGTVASCGLALNVSRWSAEHQGWGGLSGHHACRVRWSGPGQAWWWVVGVRGVGGGPRGKSGRLAGGWCRLAGVAVAGGLWCRVGRAWYHGSSGVRHLSCHEEPNFNSTGANPKPTTNSPRPTTIRSFAPNNTTPSNQLPLDF